MPQLKAMQDRYQAQIEGRLGELGVSLALIEHDMLRIEQAIRRTGLNDLLLPVLADQQRVYRAIEQARKELTKTWEIGQENGWEP